MSLTARIAQVRERIAAACLGAGRPADSVRLVSVTKTVPVETIREAIAGGLTDLGENRVQEAAAKIETLGRDGIAWHLIGHLQSNKAGRAVQMFDLIHSVDSEALAREIDRRAGLAGKKQRILIQVNCSGEESKSGCAPGEVAGLSKAIAGLGNLWLEGLMTIGPLDADPESARPAFVLLRNLRDETQSQLGRPLPELSMGMTGDLEVAIGEGATMVRVGSAIFGERR